MFGTFVVMAAIEMSLLIDKPNARYFAVTILAVGLILRGLVQERRMKKEAGPATVPLELPAANSPSLNASTRHTAESILCAIRGTGRTLDFALREAGDTGRRLYLLFVREQQFMTEQDAKRKWQEDPEASDFSRSETKSPGSSSAVLLCRQSISGGNDCRCCRDARRVTRYSRRAATQRADQSPSRQRHSRSLQFVAGRNRSTRLRVKMYDYFDLGSLRKHVERRNRIDREFLRAVLSSRGPAWPDCRKRKSVLSAQDRELRGERFRRSRSREDRQ